jgi:hypothetical protein
MHIYNFFIMSRWKGYKSRDTDLYNTSKFQLFHSELNCKHVESIYIEKNANKFQCLFFV